MESSRAHDCHARAASIDETRSLADQITELAGHINVATNRSMQYWFDQDGSLVIEARLPARAGALLMKAIDKAVEDL